MRWLSSGAAWRLRSDWAISAKARAASSVIWRLLRLGRKRSGDSKSQRSFSRFSGVPVSSMRMVWTSDGVPVKCVWIWIRWRSETTSSGGLSSASA